MTSLTLPNGSAPWGGVTNDATARLPDHADNRATRTNANSAFVRTTRLATSIHVQSGLGSYLPLHGPERGHRNADNEKALVGPMSVQGLVKGQKSDRNTRAVDSLTGMGGVIGEE